ncbi:Fic family protein [Aliivibrio fischeri]|uniref:Fic family protein n=1 Tax=Aliivibrio fischeri TaxID=668 RepID=UPI0007C4F925|nr:Fic family protein [Aliivibrio fischeri]MBP3155206.1 Fic family protein [Aliivibrio fischeri]MCE7575602.1 Fic family protein [Aliivibrio fischeri]
MHNMIFHGIYLQKNKASSTDILSVDDAENTMVHIKTTKRNDNNCKVYWNKRNSCIYTKKSVTSSSSKLKHIRQYNEDFRNSERDVQIGDSVCYIFAIPHLPLLFCSITGIQFYENRPFVYLEPNNPKTPIKPMWQEFLPERFIFVNDNRFGNKNSIIMDTEIYAICRDELDIAEEIYAETRVPSFLRSYIEDSTKPIGENAFRECHLTLFKGIYNWAGIYRNNEVIVQTEKRATAHPSDISIELNGFFNTLTRSQLRKIKDKDTLIRTLVDTHKTLAWIHPFQDGNGRSIRLFLELISLTRGYRFNLDTFICNRRGKKSYYHAVRQSLKNNHLPIKKLFTEALSKIK